MSTGDKSFFSSGGSVSRAISTFPQSTTCKEGLSAEEIGKMFGLGPNVVKCLAARPYTPDYPVLFFEYLNPFYDLDDWEAKEHAIVVALEANGGQRLAGMQTLFGFAVWPGLLRARRAMQNDPNLRPVFHYPSREELNEGRLNLTIKSCVMNMLHDAEYEIQEGFEFFILP